ncbi:MAG: MDR family MFS transporter [Chloroflexota bacterium]|nr:MFS transporter [Dehalococcoidia bacterium]MDW8252360.1 MDR family MFS transporter [Chloroflexota bacterium]
MVGRRRQLVTLAVLTGIFLAATEATIVATAMPTIVGRLGGVDLYAWVFTAYFLTSSTTVPVFGKLADLSGRRRTYLLGVGLFVVGSLLCGLSGSMEQLIAARVLQGVGAGAIQPLAFTIVGDLYALEERARIQGLFSAVWGLASVIAPVLGALIVEQLAWQWIFLLNVPVGLVSAALVGFSLVEPPLARNGAPIDWAGAGTLIATVTVFQFALIELRNRGPLSPTTLGLTALFLALLAAFVAIERRAAAPVLPFALFQHPIIRASTLGALALGAVVFSAPTFIPVLVQGARGGTVIDAGIALIPLSIGWTIGAVIAGRIILTLGYRWAATVGTIVVTGSALGVASWPLAAPWLLLTLLTLLGIGAGFGFTAFTVSVQNAVDWSRRGVATSTVQFARMLGGTVGVAMLGALFSAALATRLDGVDAAIANQLLDARQRAALPPDLVAASAAAIGAALGPVLWLTGAFAAVAVAPALLMPRGSARRHVVPNLRQEEPAVPERAAIP